MLLIYRIINSNRVILLGLLEDHRLPTDKLDLMDNKMKVKIRAGHGWRKQGGGGINIRSWVEEAGGGVNIRSWVEKARGGGGVNIRSWVEEAGG